MCEHKARKAEAKPRILILAAANISTCPRAMRMVEILKDDYDVSVMGIDSENGTPMPPVAVQNRGGGSYNLKSFSYPTYKKRNVWQELVLWCNVALRRWDKLSFIANRLVIIEHLCKYSYDIVICHDLLLLPVLFMGLEKSGHKCGKKGDTQVVFDAREFYPLQNTSSLRWQLLFKRFNTYLCATYAPKVDSMFSVSPAFCDMYKKHFGLNAQLLMSLPPFYNLSPTQVDAKNIKILYHGALNRNRDIDKVIEICQWLDERFCIDFIFTGGERAFAQKIESRIKELQSQGKKIRLLPPVDLEQIVPFGNSYDIGLLYIPPHNHNLLLTLPNKFFEYIQSRLALLIPPLTQIMPFVQKYDNAIIARDFEIRSLADVLCSLNAKEIMCYKQNSIKAAQELNLSANVPIVHNCIKSLLHDT